MVGEVYRMAPIEERSKPSHDHFFACVQEAWLNLPDAAALQFPSADHLRKHGLVRCGYADKMTVACKDRKEARAFAIECGKKGPFSVVDLDETVVTLWTAHSQSYRFMGKQAFQKSKDDVLDWLSEHIGVSVDDLRRNARAAA